MVVSLDVGDGRRSLHSVIIADAYLRPERLACDPGQNHVHGALGAGLIPNYTSADAAREVAFDVCRAQRLASDHLQTQRRHRTQYRHSLDRAVARRDHIDIASVGERARVVFHHSRHGRYSQLPRRLADQRAGQAIPSRVEGWTGNDEVRLHLSHRLFHGGNGLVFFLHEVVVAGDYRGDHRASISENLVQGSSRADGTLPHLKRKIVCLLTANSREELVDVVQRSNLGNHDSPPRLCGAMLSEAPSDD